MSNIIQIEITDENIDGLTQLSLGETAEKKLQIFNLNRQISAAQATIDDCQQKINNLEA